MKHIKLFEGFLNESKVKYSKNWKQMDDNFLKNITSAQSEDAWGNKEAKASGKERDPIKAQRALAQRMLTGFDDAKISNATDSDVKKYLNDRKKFIKDELETSKAYFSIEEKLEDLIKAGKVGINVMGDSVPDNLKSRFIMPCLKNAATPTEAWKFIKDATSLQVHIENRKVVNKFDVVYSGFISVIGEKIEQPSLKGDPLPIEFKDVNNGLAVTLG